MKQSIILYILLTSAFIFEAAAYCSYPQTDLPIRMMVDKYGHNGKIGPVTKPLENGVSPGTVISVVANTLVGGIINIYNNNNLLTFSVKIEYRINNNFIHVNSYGDNEISNKLPTSVVRGSVFTTTLVYEADGYRVFLNGQQIGFYKHKISKELHQAANKLEIVHDRVYKIVYLANGQETGDGGQNAPTEIYSRNTTAAGYGDQIGIGPRELGR